MTTSKTMMMMTRTSSTSSTNSKDWKTSLNPNLNSYRYRRRSWLLRRRSSSVRVHWTMLVVLRLLQDSMDEQKRSRSRRREVWSMLLERQELHL